jgi:hypothetical protein
MLRRSGIGGGPTYAPQVVHEVLANTGMPLDSRTRGMFESSFGQDFSQVRIHTGPRAAEAAEAVAARAFTVGSDIVFGAGEHQPGSTESTRLIAHELTHVVQQGQPTGRRESGTSLRIDDPDDGYERQAREAETPMVATMPPALQRVPKPPGAGTPKAPDAGTTPDAGTKALQDISHVGNILTDAEKARIVAVTGASAPIAPPKFAEAPRMVIHDTAVRVEDKTMKPKPALRPADAGTVAGAAVTGAATGPSAGAAAQAAAGAAAAAATAGTLSPAEREQWRRESESANVVKHRSEERGPLDEGAAVWVLRTGEAVVARPNFFDPQRPTATEYEKRADLLISQEQRERAFQAIWKAAKPAIQQQATQQSLAGLELTLTPKEQALITKKAKLLQDARANPKIKPKDVAHEVRKGLTPAEIELEKSINERARAERKLTPAELILEHETATAQLEAPLPASYKGITSPKITTTASWTVAQVCTMLSTTRATDLTDSPEKAKNLTGACGLLSGFFQARNVRAGALVNVEVFPSEKGSDCETDPAKVVPLPTPFYEEGQYEAIAKTYLQASLQAGRFPEVTTHFWVDRKIKGAHCDPRCFDLQHLYNTIAKKLGHAAGSRYGDKPKPGIVQDTNNVWWHPKACGPPPG